MNRSMKIALLIMATGLVLAGCASLNQKVDGLITTKWDKAEKSTAVIYFDENVQLYKVDGKANVNAYGQAAPIRGSGTQKDPKARLVIPAGERKLVISYREKEGLAWHAQHEVSYTFVAGRYYQLSASVNRDVSNPNPPQLNTQGGALGALKSATEAQEVELFAMNLQITDISGGKKKNSPSIVIVAKSWEQK